jgi:hypothetical protein
VSCMLHTLPISYSSFDHPNNTWWRAYFIVFRGLKFEQITHRNLRYFRQLKNEHEVQWISNRFRADNLFQLAFFLVKSYEDHKQCVPF